MVGTDRRAQVPASLPFTTGTRLGPYETVALLGADAIWHVMPDHERIFIMRGAGDRAPRVEG